MGTTESIQQCRTNCNSESLKSVFFEGNGDVVLDKVMETVDLTDLLDSMGSPTPIRVERVFDVELTRTGEHWRTLGLLVSPDDDPQYLIVDDVWEPSLASEWNLHNGEDVQLRPDDMILSVNGVSGDSEAMLATIQASGKGSTLKITLQGCP